MMTMPNGRTHEGRERVNTARVLIVEDEDIGRRLLRAMLASIDGLEIVGEAMNAGEARRKIADLRPDVVVMDIEIPGGNGIEVLRGLETSPQVIFVTGHPEFALASFEVQPVDFLTKPVQLQRFSESIQRAKRRVAERRVADLAMSIASAAEVIRTPPAAGGHSDVYCDQLPIRVRRRRFWLSVSDIAWIEGASQYSRVHAKGDEFLLSRSLSSLECELDPKRFFRVHRSAIVNATHVREIRSTGDGRYNVFLHGGQALPVGRSRREILSRLFAGIGRGMEP
jgi:two-component system LytT family response regulator